MEGVTVRPATAADLDAAVALCDAKRALYAGWQPVFHRVAAGASASQKAFMAGHLARPESLLLIAEDGGVAGFLWAKLVDAPPVYNPGGQVIMVDDFVVRAPADWATAGRALLDEAVRWGQGRGAVLLNVICGPQDAPKRALMTGTGMTVATEWFVRPV